MAGFQRFIDPQHEPAKHHMLLCEALDKVCSGEIKRLMVFMPPGSAKSTYATIRFPAYYLGKHPDHGVICASHNEDLADEFGRKVRNQINSADYQAVFPEIQLTEDSRAKGQWATTGGGFYYSCGVGSSVTGRRGKLLIADDLVKGKADADSEGKRDTAWNWWLSDYRTRGNLDGYSIVLIGTRWHEDDVSGRILPEHWEGESGWVTGKDGEQWYVICMAAQAAANDPLGRAKGEWLWPEAVSPESWEATKAVQSQGGSRNWNALYQQTPTAEDGTFFRKEWFRSYKNPPDNLNVYLTMDAAQTQDGGDFTEIAIWGVDALRRGYALDWWYGQTDADEWTDALIEKIKLWSPQYLVGERSNIEVAVVPFLRRSMLEHGVFTTIEFLTTKGDKQAKCASFQAMQSNGLILWPETSWAQRAIDQLLKFPGGKHDDVPDACGNFGRFCHKIWGGTKPQEPKLTLEAALAKPLTMRAIGALDVNHMKRKKTGW